MGYLQNRGIHIDRHLSNMAINYRPGNFIADMIYPVVIVDKQSNVYPVWAQEDLFRIYKTDRAPGHEANKIEAQVSSGSYYADNYALKADVPLETRANADPVFTSALEAGRVQRVMDGIALDWEDRVATQATNTANVGTSANVGSSWTDYTNSNPWDDINTQIDNVENGTGYRPNNIVFCGDSFRHASRNDKVIDKIRETGVAGGGNNATRADLAALFQVDNVHVGASFKNTGEEGAGLTLERIWGNHVLLYYAPPSPSIELPSFAYSLRWVSPGLPNMQVERHPYNSVRHCDELEVGYYQDEVITAAALGALVANTTSSQ